MAEVLFQAADVEEVLRTRLALRAALPSPPSNEGKPSVAFPGLRSTRREIYRLLSNTHYPHLVTVLDVFEAAHAAGCTFGHLLSTSDRHLFGSLTAEVLVAEHLLARGFDVSTIPRTETRAADLHVTGNGVDIAVEVYTPREWLEIDAWMNRLLDFLKYVDVPSNFRASAHTRLGVALPPSRIRAPWELAEMLRLTHASVFAALSTDVTAALARQEEMEKIYRHPGTDLETTVTLDSVRASGSEGLSRSVTTSPPGYIGYSPIGIFRHVVSRARKKAGRRQAQMTPATSRGLFVNLMSTQIEQDLLRPPYLEAASRLVEDLEPARLGLDLIAFYVRALPRGVASIFSVFDDARLREADVKNMLGPFAEAGG